MKQYFEVEVNKYVPGDKRVIVRPASLNHPKDNAVMFVTESFVKYANALMECRDCLVFWPDTVDVPAEIDERHAVCKVNDPHKEFARFFSNNHISYLPNMDEYEIVNGAYIAKGAVIGANCRIFPGAYIGGEVEIGDHVYIGSGVKLIGEVHIGNHVIIRENTVIGADSMTTDRDSDGTPLTIPQFGSVVIEDYVQIGANSVVSRGAIDETRICYGAKIDNEVFVSHNVCVGKESFVIGSTLMMGSSSVGEQAQISGGCLLNNYVHIGDRTLLGMCSLANKSIPGDVIAYGSPAKVVRYQPGYLPKTESED